MDSKKIAPAEAGRAALAVLKANCAHAGEFSALLFYGNMVGTPL